MAKPEQLELRPSNAHRWMNCPGQIKATKDLPDRAGKAAERGTVAHALLELAVRLDYTEEELERFVGKRIKDAPPYDVDEEMVRGVGHALDYARSYCATHPSAAIHSERFVEIAIGSYHSQGTTDLVVDDLPVRLIMVDYKHGVKVVDAEENPQLTLYALGYLQEHRERVTKETTVGLVIVQPNAQDGEPPVREYEVQFEYMAQFQKDASAAADAAHKPNPPRKAGDHCRFCRAAGDCRAYADYALASVGMEFSNVETDTMPTVQELKPKDIAAVLSAMDLLRAWIVSVEDRAIELMLDDKKIPGYKVVGSRPQRRWDDEQKVLNALLKLKLDVDKYAPRAPLSPSQMEKATQGKKATLPPKVYQKLVPRITHNPVEPRAVPVSDSRPPFVPGSEFKE